MASEIADSNADGGEMTVEASTATQDGGPGIEPYPLDGVDEEEVDKIIQDSIGERDDPDGQQDDPDGDNEDEDPRDLKARGNTAWQNGETQEAVDLWNTALKLLINQMREKSEGKVGKHRTYLSPLSDEYRTLEKALYLNLGQGYLRLGEPKRALRACQIILHDDPNNAKALHRTAEAHLALQEFDKVKEWAEKLPRDAEGALGADAQRLIQRAQASKKAEIKRQKATAKAMFKGGGGYSDDKPKPSPEQEILKQQVPEMGNPAYTMAIGEAAAKAAREREERQKAGPSPGEAQTYDLDSFRAKIMAKSAKYRASAAKSTAQTDRAQRNVKLDWIRSHAEEMSEEPQDFESLDRKSVV